MNLNEIVGFLFCLWVIFKLIVINHNQTIIVNNQKTLNQNLKKLFGKDKSILDDLFKEK